MFAQKKFESNQKKMLKRKNFGDFGEMRGEIWGKNEGKGFWWRKTQKRKKAIRGMKEKKS